MASTQIIQTLGGVQTGAAVGTTLSGALAITAGVANIVAAAGQVAFTLPADAIAGTRVYVLNNAATAVALTPFPATASGKINNGSAGATGTAIPQNKAAEFVCLGADSWLQALGT